MGEKTVIWGVREILFLFGLFVVGTEGLWCDRTPTGIHVPKTAGDDGFKIIISGDPDKPDKYIPGAVYTVRLQGPGTQYTVEKFSGFLLVAEPADGHSPEVSAGSFQLTSDSLARFSEFCPLAVKHASELPKAEVQVRWTAPPVSAGCVFFRATVIKNNGQWFMDDGSLTKQMCPENEVGEDEEDNNEPCCACDEAKYELTFEGLWSSLTHPKDFPADAWSAHFSDIIGASHSNTFRFWEYGGMSSEGIRQVAETGDSRDLESELKNESGNIRTIIKARGLKHPNIYTHKTFAVFRADKDHNLISLVSKIAPSPDWFVGVSGMNLCLRNCSWLNTKNIPLYPWDAGTDNGVSYLSPNDPTIPRDRIRRIVWKSDKDSPFYDPNGNTVKPFARLRLQKQRSYERECEVDTGRNKGDTSTDYEDDDFYDDNQNGDRDHECAVTMWSPWSPCSVTCGKGAQKRTRQYINEEKAKDCNRKLTLQQNCYAPVSCKGHSLSGGSHSNSRYDHSPSNPYSTYPDRSQIPGSSSAFDITDMIVKEPREDACAVSEWSPWSTCTSTGIEKCGQGIRHRFRRFVHQNLAESQNCAASVLLRESGRCQVECSDGQVEGCETTDWGDWGECNSTCGAGFRTRSRMYADRTTSHRHCGVNLIERQPCVGDCLITDDMKEVCLTPKSPERCTSGNYNRWYFDSVALKCLNFVYTGCKKNRNNFITQQDCENACGAFAANQTQTDEMMRHPSNGHQYHHSQDNNEPFNVYPSHGFPSSYNDGPSVDCVVSEWSPWTKCSVTCGRGHKYRRRYIKVFNMNGGTSCPKLEHRRKCNGTMCPHNHPYSYHTTYTNNYHDRY